MIRGALLLSDLNIYHLHPEILTLTMETLAKRQGKSLNPFKIFDPLEILKIKIKVTHFQQMTLDSYNLQMISSLKVNLQLLNPSPLISNKYMLKDLTFLSVQKILETL